MKTMPTVGLFDAKQRLSELVDRASRNGERIGITRRGRLAAILVPPERESDLREIFDEIEKIRKRARLPKGVKVKDLIEEGRI
jgi:prevent-host-death family protein